MPVVAYLVCHKSKVRIFPEHAVVQFDETNEHSERRVFTFKTIGFADEFPRPVRMQKIVPEIAFVLKLEYLELADFSKDNMIMDT